MQISTMIPNLTADVIFLGITRSFGPLSILITTAKSSDNHRIDPFSIFCDLGIASLYSLPLIETILILRLKESSGLSSM